MSRPPRPPYASSPSGEQPGRPDRLDYLPLEFADFLDMEIQLAERETGVALPGGDGDMTLTALQLPALLAHILGAYQDLYAAEAFLSTAATTKSLVRHARRLAYKPDAGLAATGYEVLTIGEGLKGSIPAGFAFASSPLGDVKGQIYENLATIDVNAGWNDMRPTEAVVGTELPLVASSLTLALEGTGLDLSSGEMVLLEGQGQRLAFRIEEVEAEDEDAGKTRVRLHLMSTFAGILPASDPAAPYRLLAKPELDIGTFGANADPVHFPPNRLAAISGYSDPASTVGAVSWGYIDPLVDPALPLETPANFGNELYLEREVDEPLVGQPVIVTDGLATGTMVGGITEARPRSIAFRRGETVPSVTVDYTVDPPVASPGTEVLHSHIADTLTALTLQDPGGAVVDWVAEGGFPSDSRILTGWREAHTVLAEIPNSAPVSQPLSIPVDLGGMRPGRKIVFASLDETRIWSVELTSFEQPAENLSLIRWQPEWPAGEPWALGDFKILGNVARISHGETTEEGLGSSDGVTPYQRYPLNKTPVTQVPGADGGEPALEVRVNGVAWTRVEDFHGLGSEDRVYRIEIDEHQAMTVVFGGEGRGAIPPAGKRNITVVYRVGLGTHGNAAEGRVSRIPKSTPVLERAVNLTPISGGAGPAAAEDIRTQATRFIRTFDRAVSVPDHADLALLFPGVARAAARWIDDKGVELVVATAAGDAIEATDALRAFMDARRDITVSLTIGDPQAVDLVLDLDVKSDPAHLNEIVKLAVQDVLYGEPESDGAPPGLFAFAAREFGQAAFLSQLYEAVAAVEGVAQVLVTRFDLPPGTGVSDTILATPRQWLRLKPENCAIAVETLAAGDVASASGGGA
jgi:hypothetical protein